MHYQGASSSHINFITDPNTDLLVFDCKVQHYKVNTGDSASRGSSAPEAITSDNK